MKLMIVAGSHAEQSQSARTADFLQRRAIELNLCAAQDVQVQDLGSDPLPLWNASHRTQPSRHGEFL